MFCEKCGTKLDDGSLFCDNCGAKVITAAPPVQQQIPALRRPPIAKSTKIFLFELLLFAALIFAFFAVANSKFSANATARTYAKAKAAGDWETVYSLLDVSSSELLSEDLFVSVQLSADYDEIDDYEIEEMSFGSTENKSQFSCTFETDYNDMNEVIEVRKQSGKKWLFFDDWKINTDHLIASEVQISVPADATITLNGIDLSAVKKIKIEEHDTTNVYLLPDVFRGTYLLEVSAPGRETRCEEIVVANYAYYNFTDMTPSSEAIDTVATKSRDNIETIFTGLMAEKSYENFITENNAIFQNTNNFSYSYDNWLNYFNGEGYYIYDDIMIDDIECTLSNYGFDSAKGAPFLKLNLESSIELSGYETYHDWWNNTTEYIPCAFTDRFYASFTYVLIGEDWVVTEINFY